METMDKLELQTAEAIRFNLKSQVPLVLSMLPPNLRMLGRAYQTSLIKSLDNMSASALIALHKDLSTLINGLDNTQPLVDAIRQQRGTDGADGNGQNNLSP